MGNIRKYEEILCDSNDGASIPYAKQVYKKSRMMNLWNAKHSECGDYCKDINLQLQPTFEKNVYLQAVNKNSDSDTLTSGQIIILDLQPTK